MWYINYNKLIEYIKKYNKLQTYYSKNKKLYTWIIQQQYNYKNKTWIMKNKKISEALTHDHHFEQEGLKILIKK